MVFWPFDVPQCNLQMKFVIELIPEVCYVLPKLEALIGFSKSLYLPLQGAMADNVNLRNKRLTAIGLWISCELLAGRCATLLKCGTSASD